MKVTNIRKTTFYTDLPDVDIDFSPAGRDLVKDYIKRKYGHIFYLESCVL